MSFTFGFTGDDIEDEGEYNDQDALANSISEYTISAASTTTPLQSTHTVLPKRHLFEDLLASLPSQISYNTLNIHPSPSSHLSQNPPSNSPTANNVSVHRRAVFDIRAHLMAEANPDTDTDDDSATLLAGLENGDLTSGVYEGGFKTWECALDLASHALTDLDLSRDWEIIELGAGSAVPSLALLRTVLASRNQASIRFTLCDYNEDVLRLATAPNILLNYLLGSGALVSPSSAEGEDDGEDGDLDIEALGETFIDDAIRDMQSRKIHFDFISGGWGDAFLNLLTQNRNPSPTNLLILASETIYSPASTKIFADTLVRLIQRHAGRGGGGGGAKAWVAAKKVYFGVGGGVNEFVREIQSRGGQTKLVDETKDTGVGRVILEVAMPS